MNSSDFLSSFFGGKPDNSFILIWTKATDGEKSSIWFQDPNEAAAAVRSIQDRDVYFGVGASPRDFGPHERCVMDKIAAIFGLWIDIDIQDNGHKKKNLPGSLSEAEGLLNECPLRPSYIIHSGGGLQAYWLFDRPVIFSGPEAAKTRHAIYQLEKSWNAYFKQLAARHKWDLDSVHDLARVMRLPETFNCKIPGVKRPVKVVDQHGEKYNPADLAEFLRSVNGLPEAAPEIKPEPPERPPETPQAPLNTDYYSLDPLATYDPEMFDALAEIEPKFVQTWQHKRKDFQDQSLSTYDMSLIGITLRAGWPVQEIVNLVTHHRRKYGDEKVDNSGRLRRDYYDRSIQNARQLMNNNGGAVDALPTEAVAQQNASGPEARGFQIAALSNKLGVEIKNIGRVMEDTPYFRLDLKSGVSINLGDAGGILDANKFRVKVGTAAKVAIPRYKPAIWDNIAGKLLACAEDETPDPLETSGGFVKFYLRDYLNAKIPVPHTDPEAVAGHPFHWNESIYITLARFIEWLTLRRVGIKNYTAALKSAGCVRETRHVGTKADGGEAATKSCWLIPTDIFSYEIVKIRSRE